MKRCAQKLKHQTEAYSKLSQILQPHLGNIPGGNSTDHQPPTDQLPEFQRRVAVTPLQPVLGQVQTQHQTSFSSQPPRAFALDMQYRPTLKRERPDTHPGDPVKVQQSNFQHGHMRLADACRRSCSQGGARGPGQSLPPAAGPMICSRHPAIPEAQHGGDAKVSHLEVGAYRRWKRSKQSASLKENQVDYLAQRADNLHAVEVQEYKASFRSPPPSPPVSLRSMRH